MDDVVRDGRGTDPAVVSEAFAAARALLQQAETDAAQVRTAADRYARQRELEAELLVAKARRVLLAAEAHVAAHLAAAGPPPGVIDLDGESTPRPGRRTPAADASIPTALDGILATAIGRAVHKAFPADA